MSLTSAISSNSILELNIGGTVFKVAKSTLTNLDGFFKTMLETDVPVIKDESGNIFIDRSPRHFELILTFMRNNFVKIPSFHKHTLELRKEAQFYQLDELAEMCYWKIPFQLQNKISRSEKECFEASEQLIDSPTQNTVVKLNIGGTVFQTTKSTLIKSNGFFRALLETNLPVTKDDSGCFVINRDPEHFEIILSYMRDGYVALPWSYTKFTQEYIQEIQQEADYYLLDGLVKLCVEKIPIKLPVELKIIKTDGENELIQSVRDKPTLIIDYFADSDDCTFPSDIIKFISIAKKNEEVFDVYFKPFKIPKSNQQYQTHHYRIFKGVDYNGIFDDVDNGITQFCNKRRFDRNSGINFTDRWAALRRPVHYFVGRQNYFF